MAIVTTVGLTKEYDKSIDDIFFSEYTEAPSEFDKIAKIGKAPAGSSFKQSELAGLGALREKAEGTGIVFVGPTEGHEVTRTYTTYGLGFQITEESNEDDVHGNWKKMPAELAKSAAYKRETLFWDLFNSGFATHTGWDSQYVFDASGRTLLGDAGTSQNNRPAADVALSETALQASLEYFYALKGPTGRPIIMDADYLIVPRQLMWSANVLLKTQLKPGSMDNDINTIKDYGGLKLIVSRHLTSSTAWFVLSKDHDFNFLWKRNVTLSSADDFATGNALYKVTMRCGAFMNNPAGCYGTTGA